MVFKGLRFARAEAHNTTAGSGIKIAMAAISVIPLLYGALYLWAFLDPYEQLNTVPVAVVNNDKGATIDGELRIVGDEVVQRLQDNHDGLGWDFVSEERAQEGLKQGDYYMTCTIPEDFSTSIASADSDSPHTAQLSIEYNQTKNMLASQIGETVWKEVRQQVSDSVAQEYWTTIFGKVNDGASDLQEAADGAAELHEGLQDAYEGSQTITDKLGTLASGAGDLKDGLGTLQNGAHTLKNGTGQLNEGAATLQQGADTLHKGTGKVAKGSSDLASGARTLANGSSKLAKGSDQVAKGASSLASGASKLQRQGTAALAKGTSELKEKTAALPNEQTVAAAQAGSSQISSGINSLAAGLSQLKGSAQGGTGLAYAASAAHALATATGDSSAIDGAISQLKSGIESVQSGRSAAADGLSQASSGVGGAKQQVDGALSALSSIDESALDNTSKQALAQAKKLLDASQGGASASLSAVGSGLNQVKAGLAAGGSMDSGLQQISAGLSSLQEKTDAALAQASGAASQIAAGLDTAVAALGDESTQGTLIAGAAALSSGYSSFSGQVLPLVEQAPALRNAIQQLDAGASEVNSNMTTLVKGSSELETGAKSAASGASQVANGAASVRKGSSDLAKGASSVDAGTGKIASGAQSLASGITQVDDGAGQLASGAQSALDGAGQIQEGAGKLEDGSATLTDGLLDAQDGSGELAQGLEDGTAALHVTHTQEKAEVMSAPVQLNDEYFTTVKNYGTGFAPYFIALGLWVGALMGSFVFKPLNKRLIMSGGNPAMVAFANYLPAAMLGLVQMLLLQMVLQFALGLQIDNVPAYYAFGALVALVFAAIMQMLMAAFEFPGKFIAIILLMLQLTSAAGTFPIEQTPLFFQAVSPYLPMTYVVSGMRQIMTGMDATIVAQSAAVLCSFGIACFALTMFVAWKKRMVHMVDLHPVLQLG